MINYNFDTQTYDKYTYVINLNFMRISQNSDPQAQRPGMSTWKWKSKNGRDCNTSIF